MNPFDAFQNQLTIFEHFLQDWIDHYKKKMPIENERLIDAFEYALSGGKRFRPLLTILTARVFKQDLQYVLPYACGIEFLHTYSLIHDDLPAMDNASKRRGRPSLHKAFDEATAILTGDALLTEAFELAIYHKPPHQETSSLIKLLVQAAGGRGMISGQMMDLQTINDKHDLDLEQLYNLKTGAVISACVIGAALLSGAQESSLVVFKDFAQKLGIAFQIADDLEDFEQDSFKKPQTVNCVHQWGLKKAKERLETLSKEALDILESISETKDLQSLARWNMNRVL